MKNYSDKLPKKQKMDVVFCDSGLPVDQLCNKCYYCDRSEAECNAHPCRSFEREDCSNGYWMVKNVDRIDYNWKEEM